MVWFASADLLREVHRRTAATDERARGPPRGDIANLLAGSIARAGELEQWPDGAVDGGEASKRAVLEVGQTGALRILRAPHFVNEESEAHLNYGHLEYRFLCVKCDANRHEKEAE